MQNTWCTPVRSAAARVPPPEQVGGRQRPRRHRAAEDPEEPPHRHRPRPRPAAGDGQPPTVRVGRERGQTAGGQTHEDEIAISQRSGPAGIPIPQRLPLEDDADDQSDDAEQRAPRGADLRPASRTRPPGRRPSRRRGRGGEEDGTHPSWACRTRTGRLPVRRSMRASVVSIGSGRGRRQVEVVCDHPVRDRAAGTEATDVIAAPGRRRRARGRRPLPMPWPGGRRPISLPPPSACVPSRSTCCAVVR